VTLLETAALVSVLALFAVWIGYPGAIGLLATLLRRRPAPAPPDGPFSVSVVLATRENADDVAERVRDLLRTRYPSEERQVIVAHHAALDRDAVAAAVPDGGNVSFVLADPVDGKSGPLNAGVRAATGDIIVFADTFQRYEPETIGRLVEGFVDPGVGAVTGNYRLAPGSGRVVSLYWTFEKWLRRTEARVHSTVGATGAVYAVRRSLLTPLPVGLILDDVFTPMKVVMQGFRVTVADTAFAMEMRTPTPGQEYKRKVRTLTGVLQLCAWMPGLLNPLRNPVWLQFVFHKLLRLLTPWFLVLPAVWLAALILHSTSPALLLGIALAALSVVAWIALSRHGPGVRLRRILVEATLLQVAIVVASVNGLRGRWNVWKT
jgi:poly-beta-1,6-N-acetyl-D-glucosamine synthase